MNSSHLSLRAGIVVWAALVASAVAACGSDSDSDSEGAAGAGGAPSSGGAGAASAGKGGAGVGGANSGGAANSTGGTGNGSSGGAASGGTGTGGMQPDAGAGTQNVPQGGTPPATDGGGSPYTPECDDMMMPCLTAGVNCLGIFDENDAVAGFTCSNECQTVANCNDAPTGAEAEVGCVQFSAKSRCVLVCYDNGVESECPAGMNCFRYTDFPIGYCLWP